MTIYNGCAVFSPLVYCVDFSKSTKRCQFCGGINSGITHIKIEDGIVRCFYGNPKDKTKAFIYPEREGYGC